MGGPAKPGLWALSFNPLVVCVLRLRGLAAPTYADDLACLADDLAAYWRVSRFLLAATRAMGLSIELHVCQPLKQLRAPRRKFAPGCEILVPRLTNKNLPPSTGAPAAVWHILAHLAPEAHIVEFRRPCSCKVKTCLVPRHAGALWRKAEAFASLLRQRRGVRGRLPRRHCCFPRLGSA